MSSKIKIGFIVDDEVVQNHIYELISECHKDHTHFDAPVLLVQSLINQKKKSSYEVVKNFLLRVINRLEIFLVRTKENHENYRKKFSLKNFGLKKVVITPEISKSGYVYRFKNEDLKNLRELNLDVMIRCGSGILKGEILNICKHGIISLHHGDNKKYRGGPPGFWEVYDNQDSSGFIIQRLTDELDGGYVLKRGNIQTKSFWNLNTSNLFNKTNAILLNLLRNLNSQNVEHEDSLLAIYDSHIYKAPSLKQIIKYIFNTYVGAALNKISNATLVLKQKDVWEISYGRMGNNGISLFKSKKIENPKNRFLADPFIINHNGRNICFVEDYSFLSSRGSISALEIIDGENYSFLGNVIMEDFHLSFPYVFKINNNIYMVPESSENNDIRLYECEDFPMQWKLKKIIKDNISAVDSMIFKHDSIWYLLTNICSSDIGDYSSELHLFSSSDPLTNPFLPAECNPVIFNSENGRNGGLFKIKNEIYRVSQCQGKAHYGKSFTINRIRKISPNQYEEECIETVKPNFYKGIISTHHFHCNENFYVIDHLKRKYGE